MVRNVLKGIEQTENNTWGGSLYNTWYFFSPVALCEESEHRFLQEGAVDAALDGLLQHHRGPVGSKVIRELLDLLPVQVGARVGLLVDVDTD